MIKRTALGTATAKTSGTVLTISDVTLEAEEMLYVVVGCVDATNHQPTSVEWGSGNTATKYIGGKHPSHTHGGSIWSYWAECAGTETITVTFPAEVNARAMFAVSVTGICEKDQQMIALPADPTSNPAGPPSGGPATQCDRDYGFGFALSNGPVEDSPGSIVQQGGDYPTQYEGQRAGTTGGDADSNVTVREIYQMNTPEGTNPNIEIDSATSRHFIVGVICYEPLCHFTRGITTSDYLYMFELFSNQTPKWKPCDHAWHFNRKTNLWELHKVDSIEGDPSTLVATMDKGGAWSAE